MSTYEQHSYKNSKLPIIYHYDTVGAEGMQSWPNWHENIEILFLTNGEGEAVISSRPVKMPNGGLTVVNSGRIHYTNPISESIKYHCLIIDAEFLEEAGFQADIYELDECIEDAVASRIFWDIVDEIKGEKPYYEAAVKGNIIRLMSYLYRHYSKENISSENDDMIKKAIKYMKKNFKNAINVEAVADYIGFSRFYFSRCFKKQTGYSVSEYVGFLRCREAQKLMKDKNMTVSEAATECGFSDVSYFTKVYKRHMGICPSVVGKRNKPPSV